MFKTQDFGIKGKYWWLQPAGALIFIAFFGFLYLPIVLGLFLVIAVYAGFQGLFGKPKNEEMEAMLSVLDRKIEEGNTSTKSTSYDTASLPVMSDLCGFSKARITFLLASGSKVNTGDVIAKFQVVSEYQENNVELKEYAKCGGSIELLVQLGDEIEDGRLLYKIG